MEPKLEFYFLAWNIICFFGLLWLMINNQSPLVPIANEFPATSVFTFFILLGILGIRGENIIFRVLGVVIFLVIVFLIWDTKRHRKENLNDELYKNVKSREETKAEIISQDLTHEPNTKIYRFDEQHSSVRLESVARVAGEMNSKTVAKLKHTPLVTAEDEIAFGAEVIELCEQAFDESNNVNNSFFLNDKPSQYITELDIEDFGGDLVSLTRRIVEFEKTKANLASPYSTFCKVISKDDSDAFGYDFIDLMQRITNDCLNGHRYKRTQINTDSLQTHAAHPKALEHNFKPMEPAKLAEHQKPLGGNPGRSLEEIKAQPKNSPQKDKR